jgi:hypothetical protein
MLIQRSVRGGGRSNLQKHLCNFNWKWEMMVVIIEN